MTITGNKYQVTFGMATAILFIESETSLTFTITQKDGTPVSIAETVAIKITPIRPQIFMLTWQEASGTTVTQIQDHENGIVYNNWTLQNGAFTNLQGTLQRVG